MANNRLNFPVISHGAEFLVQGLLMRRNILAYKAPPNHEGYDLICIHPDPRKKQKQIRVQVKSRLRVGARGFPLKAKGLDAFDFLVFVCMNVGKVSRGEDGSRALSGPRSVEVFVSPQEIIRQYHNANSSWSKVVFPKTAFDSFSKYKDDVGIELVAKALGVEYPSSAA